MPPTVPPLLAVALGLAALVWSADRFVDGAAASARLLGVPALLVGMVVVGFGTSAPELTVSALSAWQGNPAIALGNAWGSNICNIALILGLAAAIAPLSVQREALRFDLPQDPTAPRLQQALKERGIEAVMEQFMGLKPDEPLYDMIRAAYARQ